MAPPFKRFLFFAGSVLLAAAILAAYWLRDDDSSYTFAEGEALHENEIPLLKRHDQELRLLVERTQPSVAGIRTTGIYEVVNYSNGQPSRAKRLMVDRSGSGVVVTKEGHVVTNHHVVQGQQDIELFFYDRRQYTADLVGFDEMEDIAVLKIRSRFSPKPLKFGDSESVIPGQAIFSFGNPYALGISMTKGAVSAKSQYFAQYQTQRIQTDIATHPGHSGGPIINIHGEMIGLNTDRYISRDPKDAATGGVANLGFALPSNVVQRTFKQILIWPQKKLNHMGILLVRADRGEDYSRVCKYLNVPETGVVVDDVLPNSEAERAGMRKGDVIIEGNGSEIDDFDDLEHLLRKTDAGETIEFVLRRKPKESEESMFKCAIKIIDRSDKSKQAIRLHDLIDLGLRLTTTTLLEEIGSGKGMKIEKVMSFSSFRDSLKPMDVILTINGMPTYDRPTLEKAIMNIKGKVVIRYNREGNEREATIGD